MKGQSRYMTEALIKIVVVTWAIALNTGVPAWACPLCHSPTGEKVRDGVFNSQFPITLVSMALPFVVIAGVVAVIHHSSPHDPRSRSDLSPQSKTRGHER